VQLYLTRKGKKLIVTIKTLWVLFPKKLRKQLIILLVFVLLFAGYEIFTISIIAKFVSELSRADSSSLFNNFLIFSFEKPPLFWGIAVVSAVVLKNIFQSLLIYFGRYLSAKASGFVSLKLFNHFINLPFSWHQEQNSSDLILNIEWRMHLSNFVDSLAKISREVTIIIFIVSLMCFLRLWDGILFFFIIGSAGYFSSRAISPKINSFAEKCKSLNKSMHSLASIVLQGIKEIKVFDMGGYFSKLYDQDTNIFANQIAARETSTRLTMLVMECLGFLCLIGFYFFKEYNQSGNYNVGELVLIIVAALRILPAMIVAAHSFSSIKIMLPFLTSMLSYLELKNEENHFLLQELETSFHKEIFIKDVSFQYSGGKKFILNNINLIIRKGTMVGITGQSGSGKTTLVDLIIGLLKPASGTIEVDGVILSPENIQSWQKKIGYVPQQPYLVEGTLAENIAFAVEKEKVDENWILECCKLASMEDVFENAPLGLHTKVGERGTLFSGGQMQRIAIARALYRKPDILILDEATSSLDNKNERKWQECLNNVKGRMTIILISHKPHTIEYCDTIIFMQGGKVMDKKHSEFAVNSLRNLMSSGE
jgi:ATP-binding cassette, subfamily B, bacterial PglK